MQRCEGVELSRIVVKVARSHDLRGLTVKLRLERAITTGDPELIERLLDNLLTNAVRHNRVGGWIQLTTRNAENNALITIENTGARLRAAQITRLFQPFQQSGSLKHASNGGLGLGLTVAKAVADAHDAVITARPRPAGGLRVEVAFPSPPTLGDPPAPLAGTQP